MKVISIYAPLPPSHVLFVEHADDQFLTKSSNFKYHSMLIMTYNL